MEALSPSPQTARSLHSVSGVQVNRPCHGAGLTGDRRMHRGRGLQQARGPGPLWGQLEEEQEEYLAPVLLELNGHMANLHE